MLYSGTPGSYKSYHAVKYSIDWLKRGGNVITNFPLIYQKRVKKIKGVYEQIDNMTLTIDYLVNFAIKHHKKGVKAHTFANTKSNCKNRKTSRKNSNSITAKITCNSTKRC